PATCGSRSPRPGSSWLAGAQATFGDLPEPLARIEPGAELVVRHHQLAELFGKLLAFVVRFRGELLDHIIDLLGRAPVFVGATRAKTLDLRFEAVDGGIEPADLQRCPGEPLDDRPEAERRIFVIGIAGDRLQ